MEEVKMGNGNILGIERKYYEYFFGSRKDYYIPRLVDFENGKKYSFNVSAFFLGVFWFINRRLYKHALLISCFLIIETFIEDWIIEKYGISDNFQILMSLFLMVGCIILFGITANYFFSIVR